MGATDQVAVQRASPATVGALGFALFVYLLAEMFPVGLLPEMSRGFGTSPGQTGQLLTVYAVSAGVFGYPAVHVTRKLDRRTLIVGALLILAVTQCALAVSTNLLAAMAFRVLGAVLHGALWSAVPIVAARLAPPGLAGRAASTVFMCGNLALVFGSPGATFVGHMIGWRGACSIVAGMAVLAAVLVIFLVPSLESLSGGHHTRSPIPASVWVISATTVVVVIGQYITYTYIAEVSAAHHVVGQEFSLALVVTGVAGVCGNVVVTRWIDRHPWVVAVMCLSIYLVAFVSFIVVGNALGNWVGMVCLGAFMSVPLLLQTAVIRVAGDAVDRSSGIYVVAFQVGISSGALIGGQIIDHATQMWLPVASAVLVVSALLVVITVREPFAAVKP